MILFGIAVSLFVFFFVFCVIEMLTALGGLFCPVGGGGESWSLGLIRDLCFCLCFCPCLCFEVARSSLVRGVNRKKTAVFRLQLILNV